MRFNVFINFVVLIIFFKITSGQESKAFLDRFESSKKQEELHYDKINERIISLLFSDSISVIEIGIKSKCCIDETGDIEVIGDTIKLFYGIFSLHSNNEDEFPIVEEECEEKCFFTFKYFIKGLDLLVNYQVFANSEKIVFSEHQYRLQPIKFEIYKGDTVNYIDKYGFRQGLHIFKDNAGDIITSKNFRDDRISDRLKNVHYYDNEQVASEIYVDKNRNVIKSIEYYRNGTIKSCTQVDRFFVDVYESKYYDEQGNLIKIVRDIQKAEDTNGK